MVRSMAKQARMAFPAIKPKFEGGFPKSHINNVHGWAFSRQQILDAADERKLLTLDIDIPGKGNCTLSCPNCFRRNDGFRSEKRMGQGEFFELILQAKELGLQSAKLLGPGEPLEEKNLLATLDFLSKNGIIPLIFTKGQLLSGSSEEACKMIHGIGSQELISKLYGHGASILLGATSFVPAIEDCLVGSAGYSRKREEAILRLASGGFSDFEPGQPTRLALISAPITPINIGEMFRIYKWARRRHICHVMTPTMVAGKAKENLYRILPNENDLIDLYVKINVWNIKQGIITLPELRMQGIGSYPGAAPCNQISCGMFVLGTGKVLRCPGDDVSVQGDLKEQSLAQIWQGSENLRLYSGTYNNGCPPKDGISFPTGFFAEVMRRVINTVRGDANV
jgi:MoaA/NifB/PqqE/SkfB family radical SAM enzyme